MPKIILNIPEDLPPTQTYEVNIDFDAASRAWKINTAADNPRELRRRQQQYWKEVKSTRRRRSRRLTNFQREPTPQYGVEDDPITASIREAVLGYRENRRKSHRPRKKVKRLIEEC